MKSIFTILQDIERLIYKILMWIILIPKTIIRIILEPRWAAEYIKTELREGQSHFDEYVSPVILLLVVALLPSLGYNALPKFGVTLTSPAETVLTTDRFLSFESQVDFVSSSTERFYFSDWEVWKKNASGEYDLEKSELHPAEDGSRAVEKVDNNTIKDRFLYTFIPGEYLVYVSAGNVDPNRETDFVLETYEGYLNVTVPVDSTAQVQISSEGDEALQKKTETQGTKFLDRVKEEQTIFLALALMIPPLLFAFVTQALKVKMENIGEETLKESFYVQCYYFSPLSLAIWGTYYAYYFLTADAYWYVEFYTALQILLLPVVWSVLWFIRTEVKRIAWELETINLVSSNTGKTAASEIGKADASVTEKSVSLKTEGLSASDIENIAPSKKNILLSIVVVAFCIIILGIGANILFSFGFYMDDLRLLAIRSFPAMAILLVLSFAVAWYRRRKDRREGLIGWNVAGLVILTLAFFGVMNQIKKSAELTAATPVAVEPQSTSELVVVDDATSTPLSAVVTETPEEATPTVVFETPTLESTPTPEPPRFYTEEFNSLPSNWFDFLTFGDVRMIKEDVSLGKLSISIRPLEDKLGWYYLINNTFTYSDVKVEAVVNNQGNNANGVSLICRYSDVGWYEFVVSNSGFYQIFAVDNQGIVNQGYNEIANGGSTRIKPGLQTNVYTAICNGSELSLLINQTPVRTITDVKFQFAEGKIGLAVSSPKKLPVKVEFETLTISEP
jgi:hypothetical protein